MLSLGSNLGDRLAHLQAAVDVVHRRLGVLAVSPVYETAPVGGPPQDDYLNAVLLTAVERPWDALEAAREAEAARARQRTERWGPRTLDVDVVSVDDVVADDPELTLPHPRAHERAFVLAPWLDVDEAAELAGHGAVARLLAALDSSGVRRRDDLVLRVPGAP
ncbi:MAG TPA: 2-amino-4-hydroxy-6-hydroxymethyldihydropteridine diphosphokinase [Mycobacteriales bacterium]|nr:2-amino-4-hydroxy-6-hydroxymethyldihydropteridine diphosphokinase [Mycobacteriales bacterium]